MQGGLAAGVWSSSCSSSCSVYAASPASGRPCSGACCSCHHRACRFRARRGYGQQPHQLARAIWEMLQPPGFKGRLGRRYLGQRRLVTHDDENSCEVATSDRCARYKRRAESWSAPCLIQPTTSRPTSKPTTIYGQDILHLLGNPGKGQDARDIARCCKEHIMGLAPLSWLSRLSQLDCRLPICPIEISLVLHPIL